MNKNYFSQLKARSLLLWVFLTLIILGMMGSETLADLTFFYLSFGIWLIYKFWKYEINVSRLLGSMPKPRSEWWHLVIVIPLIGFSLGTFWLTYYPLSFLWPTLFESLLDVEIFDASKNSLLYKAGVFLLTVVVAPIIEEILFIGPFNFRR